MPDVINLPNSLLIGLAGPLRKALKRPICCTLQGEDLFLDGLTAPYRDRVLALIRERVQDVDRFIAVSDYYAPFMSRLLEIPSERIAVVPLGINLTGYERGVRRTGLRTSKARPRSASAISRASRPKRDCTCWPTPIVRFRRRTAGTQRLASKRPGYLPPAHGRLSRVRSSRSLARKRVLKMSSRIAAPSIATASSRFSGRSTCCRCRPPTTSPRACFCSRRWRAASRSCSPVAARSPRSSRRPAAGCSSRPTMRMRSPHYS